MAEGPLLFVSPIVTRRLDAVGYDFELLAAGGGRAAAGGVADLVERIAKQAPSFWKTRFAVADCAQVEALTPPACASGFLLSATRVEIGEDVGRLARAWREAGYGLCLNVHRLTDWTIDILAHADLLRFEPERAHASDRMRQFPAHHVLHAGASMDAFARGHSAGFALFQGYFFTEPVEAASGALQASYANIVNLMRLAQEDASVQRLEDVLKRDPALSFRLLRYINSAGFGLTSEIQSFKHAVTVLGYRPLRKWLALLLVTAARQQSSAALATAAVRRGRLTELLGESLVGALDTDELFIAGAFSLLHVILGVPMSQVADELPLPDLVAEALLYGVGPYAPILQLAALVERLRAPGASDEAATLCASLALSHERLNRAILESLCWAEGFGEDPSN